MLKYKKSKKTRDPARMRIIPRSRSAQVGETVSWVIATLIIVGILIIFLFISVGMSNTKFIKAGNVETDLKEVNLLKEKTSFAYQLTNYKNKDIIENILKQGG